MFALLALDHNNRIVPSEHAMNAKAAGLEIITWTLERTGIRKVGIIGVFSDWAAPVSYYASCTGLR